MKLKFTLTALFALCGLFAFADVTGETPSTGSAYYLYNVGQQKYLTVNASGAVELGSAGTQFTVATGTTSGTYTLTASAQLTATYPFGVACSNDGYYTDWKFTLLSSDDNTYTLGVLEDEDAYSFSYIFYSTALKDIANAPVMPSFTDGQWKFVSSTTPEVITYKIGTVETPTVEYSATSATINYTIIPSKGSEISCSHEVTFDANDDAEEKTITGTFTDETYNVEVNWTVIQEAKPSETVTEVSFDETATELVIPDNLASTVTVTLNRTPLTANIKNSFCVPFDLTYSQLKELFGNSVSILEFYRSSGTKIYYAYVNCVKAGVPYVIIPSSSHEGAYVISDISSDFVTTTTDVTKGNYTFKGVYTQTVLDPIIYAYSSKTGALGYYKSTTTIKGFRAYYVSTNSSSSKIDEYIEDDETGIIDLNTRENLYQPIYNTSGQMVKTTDDSVEGLAPGIYIVNGKKVVVKK